MLKESYFTTNSCLRGFAIILVGAHLVAGTVAGQLPNQAKAQISQQAALVAAQPVKVSVKLPAQEILLDSKSQADITVLNADNQPVAAPEDWQCEASVRFASGKSHSQTVVIKKGQTSAPFEFVAEETGWASIFVRPLWGGVRSDKAAIVIRPAQKSRKKKQIPHGTSRLSPLHDEPNLLARRFGEARWQFRTASFEFTPERPDPDQAPDGGTPSPAAQPVLHISLNDPNGYFRANGKDAAVISASFESPDLSPAPADIHVWFHWTNGLLDPPQPLVLKKGTFSATAQLTSLWPGEVPFSFVSSTPAYQAQGDTNFIVHFVPPGAALIGPDKLSVVDNSPVMIVFYDAQQNPVAPGKIWPVTLRSKQSKLRFAPQSFEVQATSPAGSAVLFPVSWGTDTVDAVVANYTLQPLTLVITGWMVLGLCLGGGVAGGLAAYNKFQGSWIWRIFLGILGGGVLCWLYVYLALPNVNVNIAHNSFSVFFVALLGGYGGTTTLDLVAKKLGWI